MTVFALGLNHATAPLALRERIAVAADALQAQVQALHGHLQASAPQGQPETALLSTCNRTELYVAGGTQLAEPALEWLAQAAAMPLETLKAHSYLHHDGAATRHAFRVASGLDSMVLGEPHAQPAELLAQAFLHERRTSSLVSSASSRSRSAPSLA